MDSLELYALTGVALFFAGLVALQCRAHLFWKILAVNVMGSGIFLVLLAAPARLDPAAADPVPQAMVLTGIVVAVGATGLALGIMLRVVARTGRPYVVEPLEDEVRLATDAQEQEEADRSLADAERPPL